MEDESSPGADVPAVVSVGRAGTIDLGVVMSPAAATSNIRGGEGSGVVRNSGILLVVITCNDLIKRLLYC